MLDQCPTSKKEGLPVEKPTAAALETSAATGKSYWRSLDELSGRAEFKEFLHREFPAYASELLDGSRRMFLKIMGAGLALAGAATVPGCRRPDHKIVPYNNQPEFVIAGKALYYATAMPLPGGGCEGLLAETYEGRPTKLEGNPLHPENLGKSSTSAQAQILDLYDPDRDAAVISAMAKERGEAFDVKPWGEFESFARSHFAGFDSTGGAGLAFLVEKATSPSRDALRDKIGKKWPKAKWLPYEAVDNEGELAGMRIAFGAAMKPVHDLSQAKVIVSFDRDFACGEGATLGESRGFAAGRYKDGPDGHQASGSSMSRVYTFESMMSLIGGQSDHRYAVRPSRIGAAVGALAKAVLARGGAAAAGSLGASLASGLASSGDGLPDAKVFEAIAEELAAHRGASVVMCGASQPAEVHALVAALNTALQNTGKTVRYIPIKGDAAVSSLASIGALAAAIDRGEVDTLVTIGCNPVFDAPADLGFAEKYKKVAHTIHLGYADETGQASTMHLARCHFLESWSDVESWEGVYSVVQPMIKPLFPSHNELQLLATIAGEGDTDPYATVRSTLRGRTGLIDFEKKWRRALHDGMVGPAGAPEAAASINMSAVGKAVSDAAATRHDGLEVVFQACPFVHDGRLGNNGWLQEVPHTVTKLTWDNPALMSPATARKLGISTDRHPVTNQYNHGHVVTLTVGGKSMDIAVWIQPGLADDTVVLHLGYGRRVGGRIAEGTGFNTYAVRSSSGMRIASGATIATGKASPYLLANVQDHWTMEGRDIFREVDHPRWKKFGDLDYLANKELQKDSYDRSRNVNFAGLLGMEGHAPANIDIYKGAQKRDQALRFTETDAAGDPLRDEKGNIVPIKNKYGKAIQQWGMSIDLTTCTGCAACVVACQAENNIPIVGKKEVAKGRELHWMRVDRYYATAPTGHADKDTLGIGGDADIAADPDMVVMPVTCVHCENAPCEVVCPVNATVHDEQGNNNMAYNRCIGTRYCSNNCPYKVRRFNFFDYGTKQFRGNFTGKDVVKDLPSVMQPPSEYFVPPRLREKKIEIATMQYNPHVTVRSRGMMEKCTYCIQRVNASRVETKLADLSHIPDGFVQTACQQACPTDAIVFGDIYDHAANDGKGSRVKQARTHGRSYQLLAYLNTRPRTTHMIRLRNPNPALVDEARRANWDMPLGHHHHESHGDEHHGSEPKGKGHVMSLPILTQGALA